MIVIKNMFVDERRNKKKSIPGGVPTINKDLHVHTYFIIALKKLAMGAFLNDVTQVGATFVTLCMEALVKGILVWQSGRGQKKIHIYVT